MGIFKSRAVLCRTVAAAALILSMASTAHAVGFVLRFGGLDGPTVFSGRTYNYYLSTAPGVSPVNYGVNWISTVTDAAGAGATRNMTSVITPPGGAALTFQFNGLSQPAAAPGIVMGQAAQEAVGGTVAIARTTVVVPPGAADVPTTQVILSGRIVTGRVIVVPGPDFKWSLLNPFGNTRAITGITVTPSYRDTTTGEIFNGPAINGGNLAVGKGTNGNMPNVAVNPDGSGDTGTLADYSLSAMGSGQITTTLEFMGTVNGTPNDELDLESALELFLDDGYEFNAPMFAMTDDPPSSELYVNIDLTQWLSDYTDNGDFSMPGVGDEFDLSSDGTSPDLPGYTFGTAPMTFSPGTGWSNPDPLTGDDAVYVRAMLDGDVTVPEPATLALLGSGIAALIGSAGLRGKKRAHSAH
ncbi:MAG: PEP-CTERM sorting domain-containing protein [Candidatus Brocadiia bacterium]